MPEITQPVDGDAGTTEDGGEESQGEPQKLTLTQEELDAIIATRLKRAQPKDYEALKAKAQRWEEAEAAKRSTEEAATAKAQEAEAAALAKDAKANAKLKAAAIMKAAVDLKATDTDIVLAMLRDSGDITVDDDGEVDGATAAVKALLKARPILAGKAAPASGAEFGGNDPTSIAEKIAALERDGKYNEARDLKLQQGLGAV